MHAVIRITLTDWTGECMKNIYENIFQAGASRNRIGCLVGCHAANFFHFLRWVHTVYYTVDKKCVKNKFWYKMYEPTVNIYHTFLNLLSCFIHYLSKIYFFMRFAIIFHHLCTNLKRLKILIDASKYKYFSFCIVFYVYYLRHWKNCYWNAKPSYMPVNCALAEGWMYFCMLITVESHMKSILGQIKISNCMKTSV